MGKELSEVEILRRMEKIVSGKGSLTWNQIHELQRLALMLKKFNKPNRGEGGKVNNENRDTQIVVRVSHSELKAVKRFVDDEGLTISELVRDRLPELASA